jgi:hypothetical protein
MRPTAVSRIILPEDLGACTLEAATNYAATGIHRGDRACAQGKILRKRAATPPRRP